MYSYKEYQPALGEEVFIAPSAQVIGNVTLNDGANVWFNSVIRGDLAYVDIGKKTNIQDGVMCHVDHGYPLKVGQLVTVGHGAIIHGCTVEDEVLIGMGATILNGAKIGSQSIVAAGALVPEGKEIPPRSLVVGIPGKVARELDEEEGQNVANGAEDYYQKAKLYMTNCQAVDQ